MRYLIFMLLFVSGGSHAADADLKLRIMVCESGLKHDAWGDDGKSFGIAQFRKETFYEFSVKAEKLMRKVKMWPPRWENPQHQVVLLDWGLDNGYANRWTCYKKVIAGMKSDRAVKRR